MGDDLVAAAAGEDEGVTLLAVVEAHHDVGRGVVRVDVDGVGAVQLQRGRKPDVLGQDGGDGGHEAALSLMNPIGSAINV